MEEVEIYGVEKGAVMYQGSLREERAAMQPTTNCGTARSEAALPIARHAVHLLPSNLPESALSLECLTLPDTSARI